jgi:hypothetical protein
MNFAEIIAKELRERGLDVSWSDRDQFRIVQPKGHMTFTIIDGKITCWQGKYDLFENKPLDGLIEALSGCLRNRYCVDCLLGR